MGWVTTYYRLSSRNLELCRANPELLSQLNHRGEAECCYIDKACHGIIWLLSRLPARSAVNNKEASSLASLLNIENGAEESSLHGDFGGAASSLNPLQVAELGRWLNSIDPAQMRSYYDSVAMDAECFRPVELEYLIGYFDEVQSFFSRASQAGEYVITFIG